MIWLQPPWTISLWRALFDQPLQIKVIEHSLYLSCEWNIMTSCQSHKSINGIVFWCVKIYVWIAIVIALINVLPEDQWAMIFIMIKEWKGILLNFRYECIAPEKAPCNSDHSQKLLSWIFSKISALLLGCVMHYSAFLSLMKNIT